jgi:tetratricopeptide (TPR) repeat protein
MKMRRTKVVRAAALCASLAFSTLIGACASGEQNARVVAPVAALRSEAPRSKDPELVGRWALAEMFEPGGSAREAERARQTLGASGGGLHANLARAVYDHVHGDLKRAADAYVAVLRSAADRPSAETPLVAWFATRQLVSLRSSVANLFGRHRATLDAILEDPRGLGWRAVAELEDFRSRELWDSAEATGDAFDALVTKRLGCATGVRLAGPFGQGTSPDRRRAFAAEKPGPWPLVWPADPSRSFPPKVLKVEQRRCLASSTERSDDGVFYAEVFFTTKTERELIVAAQGAVKVWVDDTPVLERDLRAWGVWQRFGAAIRVAPGRHRVLARVLGDASSIRLLNPTGAPAEVETDGDAQKGYTLSPPELLPSPNPLDAWLKPTVAPKPESEWPRARSGVEAALAAFLAHGEGMDDVATVLVEPYVRREDTAPVMLEYAALFTRNDPALPEELKRRDEKQLRTRAVELDPRLWASRSWLLLDEAEQRGFVDAAPGLSNLAREFPAVPEVVEQLARVYGRLGWRAERMTALETLAERFPDDVGALRLYLDALDEDGSVEAADAVAVRVKKLDPDAEVDLDRALARRDYAAAIAELERLEKRRPDRKEIASRIAEVLARAGDGRKAAEQLEKALEKNSEDAGARFRLADRAYARGDHAALRRAVAEALQVGAKADDLREAIDLLEGATNLEPYRKDGRAIIAEFEAWQKAGKRMEGNAARVLDYAALWVRPDGSSEMLEHEIVRIQSQEAIGKEAEQQPPRGFVLRMRVVKPDGRVLEPERVAGKPTLTMPHLEVGDYVEIEHVTRAAGDGQKGKRFRGLHWFFREADKGYWRSEFIVVSPKDRLLDIETRGQVAPPKTREIGTFVERRWRVDESPPAVEEPDSPRPTEFLPSVRIGWGSSLEESVRRLVDVATDETPLDPRLHALATSIVKGIPERDRDARARAAYRWALDNVEEGQESDGRRALTGRSGSRQSAFEHLMKQLGIPVATVLVKNRLAAPPLGPMSELDAWDGLALRIETERGPRYLTVRDKFAPYGYVPAEQRGQPAIVLAPGLKRETISADGAIDGVMFEGRADVREDGSASVELVQSFSGKIGISVRNVVDRLPPSQLQDFVESRIVARNLPGARLRELKVENAEALDRPLAFRVRAEVPQFLKPQGRGFVLGSIFPLRLAQLATLPVRETPLLLGASSHVEVKFEVVLPTTMRMPASLPQGEVRDGDRVVRVKDTVNGHAIELSRYVDVPAGRVQPGEEYARFLAFAQRADAMVERDILLGAAR